MKYLQNPLTLEVKPTTPLEAKRLSRYGWAYVTVTIYHAYQRQVLRATVERMQAKGGHSQRMH